jgi:hypothetical protein
MAHPPASTKIKQKKRKEENTTASCYADLSTKKKK